MLPGASRTTMHRVLTCAMFFQEFSDKIAQEYFVIQCCLKALGQHCIGFWLVQCYAKFIKTTMKRNFSFFELLPRTFHTR